MGHSNCNMSDVLLGSLTPKYTVKLKAETRNCEGGDVGWASPTRNAPPAAHRVREGFGLRVE